MWLTIYNAERGCNGPPSRREELTDLMTDPIVTSAAAPADDHLSYAVISCSGEWRLLTSHRQFGHFHRRASAWALAVELAKEAEASGTPVELLLQGEESDFTLNFVYRSPDPAA